MIPTRARQGERGSAIVVTLIVVIALLAGSAIVVALQVSGTRATALSKTGRQALFCAEAGLAAARATIKAKYSDLVTVLNPASPPPTWYPIRGRIDGATVSSTLPAEFEVTIRDNDDELTGAANDLTRDNDLRVFVVSTCLKYADVPREVTELVQWGGGGHNYLNQAGQGAGNTGNANMATP